MDTRLALESFEYDNKKGSFMLILKCMSIPSINKAYGQRGKGGGLYLLPEVVDFINQLKDQMILTDPVKKCPWLNKKNIFSLSINFVLNHSFWSRDTDNLGKKTQDAIFDCLGV